MSNQLLRVSVRWMIRRDMPYVMAIEQDNFEYPLEEEDFISYLRQRNSIGIVATDGGDDDEVIGFMIYELFKTRLHILDFAVAFNYQRQGVGRQMIDKLTRKLSKQRRTRITLEIRETNLKGQFFFRDCGFLATRVLSDAYLNGPPEDAYMMRYQHKGV